MFLKLYWQLAVLENSSYRKVSGYICNLILKTQFLLLENLANSCKQENAKSAEENSFP